MRTTIQILRTWDDHEPVVLGHVLPPFPYTTEADISADVEKHWDEFKATDPDSDNDFIFYLVNRGYVAVDNDQITVTLM